ncbi:HNH endonuclease [Polyangium jinanense]|uniref:HNH endonuclease n=1 Tax=Polyangium jinanense TaxID=2829994 RepID=UPI00233FFCAF|nr:HNH endonuclease [Polyangium jinanense]MDC3958542.1 HNH endonuclease [Polyangium jinanense]
MTNVLPPAILTRLQKVALDNGFDLELPRQDDWLGFASTQAPLRLWLSAAPNGRILAAVSQHNVARELQQHASPVPIPVPDGACAVLTVPDVPALHRLVRRAFQLSKTLPDELLHHFERTTANLPRTTEAERLVVQRVGQNLYRAALLAYWEGRCAITGLQVPELLRASHIKPWADCATDAERLDVFNGLLLAPHLDAVFDLGFITVGEDGKVIVSPVLPEDAREILGLDGELRVRGLGEGHWRYLVWHRERVFRKERL